MSYISPSTTITLYKGVPLDNTYEHTLYFSGVDKQNSYFDGLKGKKFTEQTYQRVHRNRIRLSVCADDVYNYNYLRFQNAAFGTKYFYAFILSCEYVNNVVCEISYQIDVMQTWAFDYDLMPSFVEREHSATDELYEHTLDEGLSFGDYVIAEKFEAGFNKYCVCMWCTTSPDGNTIYLGDSRTNLFKGVGRLQYFPEEPKIPYDNWLPASQFYEDIRSYTTGGRSENVISVNIQPDISDMSPYADLPEIPGVSDYLKSKDIYAKNVTFETSNDNCFEGYKPKNKKLYSYPYNLLSGTTFDGNPVEYHFEYFNDNTPNFWFFASEAPNFELICYPYNYKGGYLNADEAITLSGFPQCAYAIDSYKAWLAQNSGKIIGSMVGTGVSLLMSAAGSIAMPAAAGAISGVGGFAAAGTMGSGDLTSTATSAISSAANLVGTMYDESRKGYIPRGTQGSSSLISSDQLDFHFFHYSIRAEYAKIIDQYFSRYGYACRQNKVPNRNVRKNWTFTKTVDCTIKGNVPSDDMATIKAIYNKGITFWRKPENVGDFTLDNSCL
jgi:hypothetical protein